MNTLREAAQQALEALEHSLTFVVIEAKRAVRNDCADATIREAETAEHQHRVAITALRAALAEPDTCTWFQDGDSESGVYATSCRRYFDITDGTPEDNKMQWCCYCGKKLAQELIKEDEDE